MKFNRKDKEPAWMMGRNVCLPSRPYATKDELAESAAEFSDIMDSIFDLLEEANSLMVKPVIAEEGSSTRWADWCPRFPVIGEKVLEELFKAKASVLEANKMVAVQGYSAQRRIQKESDGVH